MMPQGHPVHAVAFHMPRFCLAHNKTIVLFALTLHLLGKVQKHGMNILPLSNCQKSVLREELKAKDSGPFHDCDVRETGC